MSKSQFLGEEHKNTTFNLQQILKKRFKNFSKVKKYKALENKIVKIIFDNLFKFFIERNKKS